MVVLNQVLKQLWTGFPVVLVGRVTDPRHFDNQLLGLGRRPNK